METLKEVKTTDTTGNKKKYVTGVFSDRQGVENAYNTLHAKGYTKDDINVVMSDETRKNYFSKGNTEIGSKAMEGAGAGGVIGGTIGAAAAAIVAIGTTLAIPGLGLVVAGPIAAAIAGAGAGGVAGGLIGALVGSGMTEERARLYESKVKNGKIVVSVYPRNDEDAKFIQSDWASKRAEEVQY